MPMLVDYKTKHQKNTQENQAKIKILRERRLVIETQSKVLCFQKKALYIRKPTPNVPLGAFEL